MTKLSYRFLFILFAYLQLAIVNGQDKPNIILIVADDLGYKDVSYNNGYIKTPNIDYYQSQGVKFERFYTTAPVCSPTRGAIMTGRISYRFGIPAANFGKLLQQEINLAEILSLEAYNCGHFGKWHLGTLTTEYFDGNRGMPGDTSVFAPPWEHGFSTSFTTENAVPTYDPMSILEAVNYPENFDDKNYYGTAYWESKDYEQGNRVSLELLKGDDNTLITDQALDFIQASVSNQDNFFCNIWFHTPHLPVVPREDYRNLYSDKEWDFIDENQRPFVNAISSMDFEIGRIFEFLEHQGVLENTIVWFMSDNGPTGSRPDAVGEFRGRKNTLYEGGIRVPSFLYYNELATQNKSVQEAISTLDILPTIYELVMKEKYVSTRPIDGESIAPRLIQNEEICRERPIFCMKDGLKWKAIFEGDFKLICHNESIWELYNLKEDPAETENLISTNEEVFSSMKETILAYKAHITEDLCYINKECNSNLNENQLSEGKLLVYPNPNSEKLYLDLSKIKTKATITIFNLNGKEIYSTEIRNQANFEVDLSLFKSATYIVKVSTDNNEVYLSKFVKHIN